MFIFSLDAAQGGRRPLLNSQFAPPTLQVVDDRSPAG
jgi:hypothetical protein